MNKFHKYTWLTELGSIDLLHQFSSRQAPKFPMEKNCIWAKKKKVYKNELHPPKQTNKNKWLQLRFFFNDYKNNKKIYKWFVLRF